MTAPATSPSPCPVCMQPPQTSCSRHLGLRLQTPPCSSIHLPSCTCSCQGLCNRLRVPRVCQLDLPGGWQRYCWPQRDKHDGRPQRYWWHVSKHLTGGIAGKAGAGPLRSSWEAAGKLVGSSRKLQAAARQLQEAARELLGSCCFSKKLQGRFFPRKLQRSCRSSAENLQGHLAANDCSPPYELCKLANLFNF